MQSSDYYRGQAEMCRRIAQTLSMQHEKRELLTMAADYDRKAESQSRVDRGSYQSQPGA